MTTETQSPATAITTTLTQSHIYSLDGQANLFYGNIVELDREVALNQGIVSRTDTTETVPLHVTRVTAGADGRESEFQGRTQLAAWSGASTYDYIVRNSKTGPGDTASNPLLGVCGALLSPTPVNGKTYSLHGSFIVQYFDADHISLRNNPESALNILAYREVAWSVTNDSVPDFADGQRYVEVTPPENAKIIPEPEGPSPDAPDTTPEPSPVTGSDLLDLVRSELVLHAHDIPATIEMENLTSEAEVLTLWNGEFFTSFIDNDRDLMDIYRFTSATVAPDGEVKFTTERHDAYQRPLAGMEFYRVRRTVKVDKRTAEAQAATIASMTSRIAAAESRWEDMGEALNEMARSHSWCGEYEEAVVPLGWDGRHGGNQEYDITVQVNWSFETSSTSSDLDRYLRDETNVDDSDVGDFEVDELTMSGTAYVTIRNVEMPVDDDDIDYDEYISTHSIDSLLPSGYSVDDWSYDSRTESE